MGTSSIVIRAVESGDLPALTDLWNQPQVVWGTLQTPFTSLEARQKRHAALPPGDVLLAAVMEDRLVGSAGLHGVDPRRRRAHTAFLGMGVHDAYAGRGVGRALLSALLDLADRWMNYSRVELTVWADNHRAITLYEKAGFEREGLLRRYGWRDGAYVDAIAMSRLRN